MIPLIRSLALLALTLHAATLLADEAATHPAAKDAVIVLDAIPTPATLHPGDTLKLDVTIKNNADIDQTIDVPNYAWWAHSDDPNVIFPAWPKMAGHGPVVIFKSMPIAPGQSYTHTWQATISPNTPTGDLVFHLGIPLYKNHWGQFYWSSDIKLKIEAAAK